VPFAAGWLLWFTYAFAVTVGWFRLCGWFGLRTSTLLPTPGFGWLFVAVGLVGSPLVYLPYRWLVYGYTVGWLVGLLLRLRYVYRYAVPVLVTFVLVWFVLPHILVGFGWLRFVWFIRLVCCLVRLVVWLVRWFTVLVPFLPTFGCWFAVCWFAVGWFVTVVYRLRLHGSTVCLVGYGCLRLRCVTVYGCV